MDSDRTVALAALLWLVAASAPFRGDAAMPSLSWRFDRTLTSESGTAPVAGTGLAFVPGRAGGEAVRIERPGVLTYPTAGLNLAAFTISFWVRHDQALSEYYFRRLTYFWHETPDLKNRIGILKRDGSNRLVFFFSDGQGKAKGNNFGGDWFALSTPPLDWPAGSWHQLVCTADKAKGMAQLCIDGRKVAEAQGTQFPEQLGEVVWIGTEQGHSWMRGAMDDLMIEPVSRLEPGPVAAAVAPPSALPLAPRLLGASVGQLTGKELTINIDYFDICIGTDTWDMRDCDAEMERLMALCAHYGVDRVFFRTSVCGAECYYTKVMVPSYEEVFAKYTVEALDPPCANIPSLHRRMGQVMRQIDPLAAAAKYAHKHGMQIYAWVTVFDSLYYAPPHEFFQQHPEYTWVSRDGKTHIPGVPCYAYPEVRQYRLAQMQELVDYDVDGIVLCPRSHSPWPGRNSGGGNEGSRGYGFNEPVVAEYQRRFGKDPRLATPDSLDELRFVQLKADFFTQFLREVKAVTAAEGKKLAMISSASMSDPVRTDWLFIDADTLARERIVDELCMMAGAEDDLNRWRLLADDRVRLTTFAGLHGKTYADCLAAMQRQFRGMLANPTSAGSTYHELANLIYPDCWEESVIDATREWLSRPR